MKGGAGCGRDVKHREGQDRAPVAAVAEGYVRHRHERLSVVPRRYVSEEGRRCNDLRGRKERIGEERIRWDGCAGS